MKKLILLFTITLFFSITASSQGVLDLELIKDMNNIYKKDHYATKKAQPYPPLREADVMWSRTVWQEIDLREKINHPFYYPENDGQAQTIEDRKSLIDIIYSACLSGEIQAYGSAGVDDEFKDPLTPTEFNQIGGQGITMREKVNDSLYDAGWDLEDATEMVADTVPFNRNDVKKWRLKEIWYFDKQASVMGVRIIGLCPVKDDRNQAGDLTGENEPLFWVPFDDRLRSILVNAEAFNLMKNDAERRTYDDIFWKRMFSSRIIKEANVMDRNIADYMIGLDALLEAERIKAEIFNIEHDLWEY